MKNDHLLAASRLGRVPVRRSASLIVAVCAVVAALGIAVWWNADPVTDQDAPRREPRVNSGELAVPSQSAATAPVGVVAPGPSAGFAPDVQPPGTGSRVEAHHVKPAPGDLLAAIKHAQAEAGNPTPSPSPGPSSWQGMSSKDATKVFEDAVKAASPSSAVSPFGRKPDKN